MSKKGKLGFNTRQAFRRMNRPSIGLSKAVGSCEGKKQYTSYDSAAKAIKRFGNPPLMKTYRCRYCKSWHIGRSTPGGKDGYVAPFNMHGTGDVQVDRGSEDGKLIVFPASSKGREWWFLRFGLDSHSSGDVDEEGAVDICREARAEGLSISEARNAYLFVDRTAVEQTTTTAVDFGRFRYA